MAGVTLHHPYGKDFDRFLYATVGEDRNGSFVTVLSALARLDLDPWQEASELAVLSRDASRARLGNLLSAFKDVPTLAIEHGSVAAELISLLPERLSDRVPKPTLPTTYKGTPTSIRYIFAILILILVLAQVYVLGHAG